MVSHELPQGPAKIEDTPDHITAADLYRAAGWIGPLPLPDGAKLPPPIGWTGYHAPYPSASDTHEWLTQPPVRAASGRMSADYRGTRQIALRMGPVPSGDRDPEWDTVGIDVDAYGAKAGGYTLAVAERLWGPLPSTAISSSRDPSTGSGIRFYRVPTGTILETEVRIPSGHTDRSGRPIVFSDIEIIQRSHRYAVVWPSVHPETGQRYRWWAKGRPMGIPRAADLPLLPDHWIEALRRRSFTPGQDAADRAQVEDFEREHNHNPINTAGVRGMIETFERRASSGSRHDALVEAACMAAREARAGHYPAVVARKALAEAFVRIMTAPKPGARTLTPQAAMWEFQSAWAWGIGQALAMTVEECRERSGARTDSLVVGPKLSAALTGTGSSSAALGAASSSAPTSAAAATTRDDLVDDDDEDASEGHEDADERDGEGEDGIPHGHKLGAGGTVAAAVPVAEVRAQVEQRPALTPVDDSNALALAYADLERAEQETIMARALEVGSPALAKVEARMRLQEEVRMRLAREHAAPAPAPVLLDDFLAVADEDVLYRVDGLAPVGARVMLAAQYKAGKSTTVGNLVRALADGDTFLGRTVTPPDGRIILLDNELDERMLRRWLRDQQIKSADRVVVVPLRGRVSSFNVIDRGIRAEWAAALRAAGAEGGYIILDCLRPVVDALGLSEDKDAGRVLVAFDELLAEAGCDEGMVVHHMGHNSTRVRGDSRLQDWPDVMWRLLRADDEDPSSRRSFVAYGRDVDVPEQPLVFDRETRRLSVAEDEVEFLAPAPAWDGPQAEPLPVEIATYDGPGKDAIRSLARFMRALAGGGGIGLTLADAREALSGERHQSAKRYDRMTVKRAWAALYMMGWIVPSDEANTTRSATGHMLWSDPPKPPGKLSY